MSRLYHCMEHRLICNSVVDDATGCWVWIAARDKRDSTPYGKITVYDRELGRKLKRQAHIVSYETFVGPVPEGYELDHTCNYGFCINPNHLQPKVPVDNKARRRLARDAKTGHWATAVG